MGTDPEVTVCVLLAALCWMSIYVSAGGDTTCTSPVINVLAVEEYPSGLCMTTTAATPGSLEHQEIIMLPDTRLPSQECGEGYTHCPLKCKENDAEQICTFTVTSATTGTLDSSVALLHLKQNSEVMGFQLLQEKLVPVPSDTDCVPVEVFDRGLNTDYRYIVACLNLTSHNGRYIFFLLLEYDKANISSARLLDDTPLSAWYYPIVEHSLSKLVYRESSNTACVIPGNVFMKDGPRVVTFELRDSPIFRQLEEQHEIDNCPHTLDFSAFDADLLRIQCSVGDVALYDVCGTETVVERYNATLNGTVYQCSEARLNLLLNGTFLDIRPYGLGRDDIMDNFTLPFDDIMHAKCTGKETPALFMTRHNGETYMLFLTSGQLFFLAQSSCLGESCLNLDVLRTEYAYIIGIFDYNTNEYTVANLSCSESPVIARVQYTSPALTTLALSNSTRPCHCPPQQPATEPIQTPSDPSSEDPSTEAPTDPPSSPQAPTDPKIIPIQPQDDATEGGNKDAVIGGSVSGTALGVIFLSLLVMVVAILIYHNRNRCQKQVITDPTASSTTSFDTNATALVAEDGGVGSMVPRAYPVNPTMLHPQDLVNVHNERSRGEENGNDLRMKGSRMQTDARH